jgi:hypothetical protein
MWSDAAETEPWTALMPVALRGGRTGVKRLSAAAKQTPPCTEE